MPRDLWTVDLLDRHDRTKATLGRVRSGSLVWSIFRAVPGSGTLDLTRGAEQIDWLTDRVRVTHSDGQTETPMGVWLISMPGWDTDGPVTRTTLTLLDKCETLNSPIGEWVTYPAGTAVVATVTGIITARGETAMSVTASALTLRTAQTWEPEDTWLTVVNDLLASINYASLRADMQGRLVIEPYVAPADRTIAAIYGPEPGDARLRPSWSSEADIYSLPTGARIYVPGTDEVAGFVGAADLPDDHPLSAASRGRPLLLVEQGEAADQTVANSLARRRLDEALQVTQRVTVAHPVDGTDIGDLVHHRPLGLDAAIVGRTVGLGVGAVVADTIRHIYTGGDLPWPIH